ncbi:site-specific DNA-methyltransferase [Micromonospora sp. RTP1Z1]|uniref:site-specific DNA-methyltransferase n=1 Tax=Micromonospora sp. RTP1Z1 TaxID=2994043 RepID=UPI0029C92F7E|nr:site-specific DNA-methyltransferase [Micromonospora sp. RTP1Z1]
MNVDKTVFVDDYEHVAAKRTNNPPAGLAHLDRDETPVRRLAYDPHLDPQLVWAGKAERNAVDVPAPSIHVHEELSAQKIIGSVRRQRLQQPLFDLDVLDPAQAVEFYEHDLNWSNRMILGDSLMVLTSLLDRERMAGQVQCVFMDPPYGIRYQSNFQPRISDRAVKDGDDKSLTREPEMIQAYRDTWELGVHTYLTYLRDRFAVAHELLADTGSIFIQIGEENVHRVRAVLDEVFGGENFVSQISFVTTSGAGAPGELRALPATANYLVWYAKDREQMKYRQLYLAKRGVGDDLNYAYLELADGSRRRMTSDEIKGKVALPDGSRPYRIDNLTSQAVRENSGRYTVELDGKRYQPARGVWKTGPEGMERLKAARRLQGGGGSTLSYVRYLDDFDARPLTNVWDDTVQSGFGAEKQYVVQTNPRVIARCILMTTDAGDLVVDPTCGSGTTAFVAEQYGRRWITTDTSRVALAIARERLLTARYDYYQLLDPGRGVDGGLKYRTLQRVTLRSIARGEEPEQVVLCDLPIVVKGKVRASGPFTVEALSRYAVNPTDEAPSEPEHIEIDATDHVQTLLAALQAQGIPRPGSRPSKIESLAPLAGAGALQAEGVADLGGKRRRFAVALGPKFGAITMAQVSDALREAIGFDMVVFAGFAVSADAQERLATGKVGGTQVSLLLANPDLLVGDLLKNTKASQTFRLYSAPDVKIEQGKDGYRVTVEGVDTFDAATGEVVSHGRTGVQAWFLDDDYDGTVFRVAQAFFPVTDAWKKLQAALRGTVDADLLGELHGWTSLPFNAGEHHRVAVRVIAQDGNAAEVLLPLPGSAS